MFVFYIYVYIQKYLPSNQNVWKSLKIKKNPILWESFPGVLQYKEKISPGSSVIGGTAVQMVLPILRHNQYLLQKKKKKNP